MTSTLIGSNPTAPAPRPPAHPELPPLSPAACATVAATLAAAPQRWLRFAATDAREGRWYERILREDRFEAWILGWAPGHALDFHDHGVSAGAFRVLRGALLERHTTRDSTDTPGQRVHLTGATTAFGPDHVHSVTAAGTAPTLSIHVYSPPLLTMTHYDVAAGSAPLATSTEVC